MRVIEAKRTIAERLRFGDDAAIRAVRFLERVEECRAAIETWKAEHPDCEQCDGTGKVECWTCDGTGQVDCAACADETAQCPLDGFTPDEIKAAEELLK